MPARCVLYTEDAYGIEELWEFVEFPVRQVLRDFVDELQPMLKKRPPG